MTEVDTYIVKITGGVLFYTFLFSVVFTIFHILLSVFVHVYDDEISQFAPTTSTEKELVGIWKIEDPLVAMITKDKKKGWQKCRLILHEDHSFEILALTTDLKERILPVDINQGTPIPETVTGTWSLIWMDVNWTSDETDKYPTLGFMRENGKGLSGGRSILKTQRGLRINWVAPGDFIFQRGIIWKKVEVASN